MHRISIRSTAFKFISRDYSRKHLNSHRLCFWHFDDLNIVIIPNKDEKWFDPFGLRTALKVRVDISSHVIMVMDRFFSPFSCLLCLSILFLFFKRGIRVWLGGLDIVGAKQSLSFSSLFHFFFPSSSSFQIRNVLWIVSCSSLGFDSSWPVVYRPHLGTVFVWVGVYQKERKK